MPVRRFWCGIGKIGKLRAEEDMRALHIACASSSGEAAGKHMDQLKAELGMPIVEKARREPNANEKLAAALGL